MSTLDAWLGEVRDQVRDPRRSRAALEELAGALHEAAEELGEQEACAAFGDPRDAARTIDAETGGPAPRRHRFPSPVAIDPRRIPHRIADTFEPCDNRLVVPRAWGLGWTLNLGAVAVRTGLLDPDHLDADVLGALDRRRMVLASWLASAPALAALALAPLGLAQDRLPSHWGGWAGRPDAWVEPGMGQWPVLALALGVLALAWLPRARGASTLWQLLLLVLATNLSVVTLVTCALQVLGADRPVGWLAAPGLLLALAGGLGLGVWLVRCGAARAARPTTPREEAR